MAETLRDEPVGVTIGRFQTYALTDAHRLLITKALEHSQALVLIGNNPISGTKRNPLPATMHTPLLGLRSIRKPLLHSIMPEHSAFAIELVRFAHLNPGKTQLRFGGTREN